MWSSGHLLHAFDQFGGHNWPFDAKHYSLAFEAAACTDRMQDDQRRTFELTADATVVGTELGDIAFVEVIAVGHYVLLVSICTENRTTRMVPAKTAARCGCSIMGLHIENLTSCENCLNESGSHA
jgi:hypothetical protein